jgi:hypothetical protein
VAVQEAAIVFLAKHTSAKACLRVAAGPGQLVHGLVVKNMQDPPPDLLARLRASGVAAERYSACRGGIVISVGWPKIGKMVSTVRADWLCGPACGNGYEVDVVRDQMGWRATGARMTWMS